MQFNDLPLHDATLSSVHVSHETGHCDLTLRLVGSGAHVLRFEGFDALSVPRREPWGPSCAVNVARQVSPQGFELELQSGDVIRIEARSWTFQQSSDNLLPVSGDRCNGLGASGFQDVRSVGDVVYVGSGQQVAVVVPATGRITSYPLAGYFGHLFTAGDLDSDALGRSVLVSSASELLCFDTAGDLMWRTSNLAVDGVIVHRVAGDMIEGSAEWDPPGGWLPFRLSLRSGERADDV